MFINVRKSVKLFRGSVLRYRVVQKVRHTELSIDRIEQSKVFRQISVEEAVAQYKLILNTLRNTKSHLLLCLNR